jgi:hypothetical protein
MDKAEFAPCELIESESGYSLFFANLEGTDTRLRSGYYGVSYVWHGVVEALTRMQAPELKPKLVFSPTADALVIHSGELGALREAAELIRAAIANPDLLEEAIENINPELLN